MNRTKQTQTQKYKKQREARQGKGIKKYKPFGIK